MKDKYLLLLTDLTLLIDFIMSNSAWIVPLLQRGVKILQRPALAAAL